MYDYYELEIVETGRDSLQADPESDYCFNQIHETMKTEEEATALSHMRESRCP